MDGSGRTFTWERWQFWRSAADISVEELGALLRRALIVDAKVVGNDDEGVDFVLLEIHQEGEPNRMLRLSAHGVHTEGWIVAEGRHADG